MSTIIEARTFAARTIKAEITRRKNNRVRKANNEKPVRAQSWVLPGLSGAQLEALLAGEPQTVTFKKRTVVVTLK